MQHNAASAIALAPPQQRVAVEPAAWTLLRWLAGHWEWLLIGAIVLVAALVHGINMFHFPYYEDDEGTYMAQAWAVVREGQLQPYTYIYDHAPVGWFQIAAWAILTGGFHTFGVTVESGRVLMLLMQVGSTIMLYRIAHTVSGGVTAAVVASLLFALLPFGTYYHRRVLLDNITTFWMLLSILLLVSGRPSLKRVWLSACALGISILSKELTVFLIPVLTYLVFYRSDKSHRGFATFGWVAIVCSIVSLYVLLATLKGELFPTGTLLGGTHPHVSLLGTLEYQASRRKDGGVFQLNSGFWIHARVWTQEDPMLVGIGSLCTLVSVALARWRRLVGVLGAVTLSLWAFLGRGGEVIDFYLVPLLPLLALNVGLVVRLIVDGLRMHLGRRGLVVSRCCGLALAGLCLVGVHAGYSSPGLGFRSNSLQLWTSTQAVAQDRAIAWVERNVPSRAFIVLDMYMWLDLHDRHNTAGVYRHADYYWRMEEDPAIRNTVYHNNWRTIDYVVATPQLLFDTRMSHMQLVAAALAHSTVVARFDTGGWTVEVHRVWKSDQHKNTGASLPTATVVSRHVLLNPNVEDFGHLSVSTTSTSQLIHLVNLGPTVLTVRNITITGSNPGDFAEADTCTGATIGPYGGCTIDVKFSPRTRGTRSASLTITDNTSGSPHAVRLRGRGYAVSR